MKISKIDFPIYNIIILFAIFIGLVYIYSSLKKEKKYNSNILLFFFLSIALILIFGKVFTMIFVEPDLFKSGLSSFGCGIGLIGATIIFELIMPLKGSLFKYSILALPLIYGIAKIACFIVGCCYGIPYNGIFSVTYVDNLNIPLFPIQLVESIMFLLLFLIANIFNKKNNISYIVLFASALLKFLLDFLRYDHLYEIISFNQIICLIVMLLTPIIYIFVKKKVSGSH